MDESEIIGLIKSQVNKEFNYRKEEQIVGHWIDGKPIYRELIEVTDTELIQKGILSKISELPANFGMLIKGTGIIKTYENSYSNNDILIYAARDGIYAKQNFTGYPHILYVIIEYIKGE